jgi:uncharacterized protein YfiM (DUF2279 family)
MQSNSKFKLIFYILPVVVLCCQYDGLSQDSIKVAISDRSQILNPLPVVGALVLSYSTGLLYMNTSYYPDDTRVPFHFSNDNKGFLQVDKFQHSFTSYTISYFGYQYLVNSGVSRNKALLLGGSLGFIMQTPKEIIDGHFYGAGFSWGDVVGNFAGSAFLIAQELLFNEQIFRYKTSFWRSVYAKQANGHLGKTFLQSYSMDYNGHSYWLSFNANKVFLKNKIPDWINIAAGYSANGMFGPYENISSYGGVIIPETQRYRQFLLSLDIDWLKIRTRSKFLKTMFNGLNLIKMPFPAIEFNSKGQFKGYWIYF